MATQKPPSSPRWVRFQPSQWVSLTPAPTQFGRRGPCASISTPQNALQALCFLAEGSEHP